MMRGYRVWHNTFLAHQVMKRSSCVPRFILIRVILNHWSHLRIVKVPFSKWIKFSFINLLISYSLFIHKIEFCNEHNSNHFLERSIWSNEDIFRAWSLHFLGNQMFFVFNFLNYAFKWMPQVFVFYNEVFVAIHSSLLSHQFSELPINSPIKNWVVSFSRLFRYWLSFTNFLEAVLKIRMFFL